MLSLDQNNGISTAADGGASCGASGAAAAAAVQHAASVAAACFEDGLQEGAADSGGSLALCGSAPHLQEA